MAQNLARYVTFDAEQEEVASTLYNAISAKVQQIAQDHYTGDGGIEFDFLDDGLGGSLETGVYSGEISITHGSEMAKGKMQSFFRLKVSGGSTTKAKGSKLGVQVEGALTKAFGIGGAVLVGLILMIIIGMMERAPSVKLIIAMLAGGSAVGGVVGAIIGHLVADKVQDRAKSKAASEETLQDDIDQWSGFIAALETEVDAIMAENAPA